MNRASLGLWTIYLPQGKHAQLRLPCAWRLLSPPTTCPYWRSRDSPARRYLQLRPPKAGIWCRDSRRSLSSKSSKGILTTVTSLQSLDVDFQTFSNSVLSSLEATFGPPVDYVAVPRLVQNVLGNFRKYIAQRPNWSHSSEETRKVAKLKARIQAAWDTVDVERQLRVSSISACPVLPTGLCPRGEEEEEEEEEPRLAFWETSRTLQGEEGVTFPAGSPKLLHLGRNSWYCCAKRVLRAAAGQSPSLNRPQGVSRIVSSATQSVVRPAAFQPSGTTVVEAPSSMLP